MRHPLQFADPNSFSAVARKQKAALKQEFSVTLLLLTSPIPVLSTQNIKGMANLLAVKFNPEMKQDDFRTTSCKLDERLKPDLKLKENSKVEGKRLKVTIRVDGSDLLWSFLTSNSSHGSC